MRIAKIIGNATGVTVDPGAEISTISTRKIRLAATSLIAAVLVWAGVDSSVAAALSDFINVLME